jgi:Fe-S-cluster containining protein
LRQFENFANDEPCPVLDPETGRCDLYAHRPLTCRAFGPPVRIEPSAEECASQKHARLDHSAESKADAAFGVCELCFQGATDEQIAACEMEVDPDGVESALLDEIASASGVKGRTIVAFALASPPRSKG